MSSKNGDVLSSIQLTGVSLFSSTAFVGPNDTHYWHWETICIAASTYHPFAYQIMFTRLKQGVGQPVLQSPDPATSCKMSDLSIGTTKVWLHRCMACGYLICERVSMLHVRSGLAAMSAVLPFFLFHLVSPCLRLYGGSKPFRKPSTHTPHELGRPKLAINARQNRSTWVRTVGLD